MVMDPHKGMQAWTGKIHVFPAFVGIAVDSGEPPKCLQDAVSKIGSYWRW